MLSPLHAYPPSFSTSPAPVASVPLDFSPTPRRSPSSSSSMRSSSSSHQQPSSAEHTRLLTRIQELERSLVMSREETDEAIDCLHSSQRSEVALRSRIKELERALETRAEEGIFRDPEAEERAQRAERRLNEVEEEKKGVEMALVEKVEECEGLRRRMDGVGFDDEEEEEGSSDSVSTKDPELGAEGEEEGEGQLVDLPTSGNKTPLSFETVDTTEGERSGLVGEGSGVMVEETGREGSSQKGSPSRGGAEFVVV